MRKFVIALALANLVFVREWRSFGYFNFAQNAFHPHFFVGLLSFLVAILVITPLVYVLLYGMNRDRKFWVRLLSLGIFLAVFFPLFNQWRSQQNLSVQFPVLSVQFWVSTLGKVPAAMGGILFLGGLVFVLLKCLDSSSRFRKGCYLFLVGELCVCVIQITLGASAGIFHRFSHREHLRSESNTRVVVLYFDELGSEIEKRYPEIKGELPNFNRLRRESIDMTQALAPGTKTIVSIPGSLEQRVIPYQPHAMGVTVEDSLFSDVKDLGKYSSVVGWHLPYCKRYGDDLDRCVRLSAFWHAYSESIPQNVAAYIKRIFIEPPEPALSNFNEILSEARERVIDKNFDLVFIHWNIPHLPGIQTHNLTATSLTKDANGRGGYVTNLKLMDSVIGEIRRTMENGGEWARTSVILLSDHGEHAGRDWLTDHTDDAARRVVFMVKLAGQNEGYTHTETVQTMDLRPLVKGLLNKELTTYPDVARLLRGTRLQGININN